MSSSSGHHADAPHQLKDIIHIRTGPLSEDPTDKDREDPDLPQQVIISGDRYILLTFPLLQGELKNFTPDANRAIVRELVNLLARPQFSCIGLALFLRIKKKLREGAVDIPQELLDKVNRAQILRTTSNKRPDSSGECQIVDELDCDTILQGCEDPKEILKQLEPFADIKTLMARNKHAAAKRQRQMTESFFGLHAHNPNCMCGVCKLHPVRQLQKQADGSRKGIVSGEAEQYFIRRVQELYPEEAEKLFTEAKRADRSAWDILGQITAANIKGGDHPLIITALEALQSFSSTARAREKSARKTKSSKATDKDEPKDLLNISRCIKTFLEGLYFQSELQTQHHRAAISEQEKILADDTKSEGEKALANLTKQGHLVEINNVRMRVSITQVRFFNQLDMYGHGSEVLRKVILDHINLPGGASEDPVGLKDALNITSPDQIEQFPFSQKEMMNDLVLSAKDIDQYVAKNAPVAASAARRKNKKNKNKKGGKQETKQTVTESGQEEASMEGASKSDKGKARELRAGNLLSKENAGREGQTAQEAIEEAKQGGQADLGALFERHRQQMRHAEPLERIMKINMEKLAKMKVEREMTGQVTQTTKFPVPPDFHFQGHLVSKDLVDLPQKIREAIWNFDFLLDELATEEPQVSALRDRIYTSIQSWSVHTDDEEWAKQRSRLIGLPCVREYAALRETLHNDVVNAYCENLKFMRFFEKRRGKKVFEGLPEQLRAKLVENADSVATVDMYWRKYMIDFYDTAEELLGRIHGLRAPSSMPPPADAEEAKKKEWWSHLVTPSK